MGNQWETFTFASPNQNVGGRVPRPPYNRRPCSTCTHGTNSSTSCPGGSNNYCSSSPHSQLNAFAAVHGYEIETRLKNEGSSGGASQVRIGSTVRECVTRWARRGEGTRCRQYTDRERERGDGASDGEKSIAVAETGPA